MYWNSMSEFKIVHTLHYFLLAPSCDPTLLHKGTQFSPCLMLANPLTLSQLLLVSIPSLSLDFAPKHILSFRSPLVVIQRGFPPQYLSFHPSHIHSEDRNADHVTKSLTSIINKPLPQHYSSSPQKSWYEGCGQDQTPFPLCQTSESTFGLSSCSQGLNPGWLKGWELLKAWLGFRHSSRQKGCTQNTNTLLIFADYQKLKNHGNESTDLKWEYLNNCIFKSYG